MMLIVLWATSSGVETLARWQQVATSSIGFINTLLITIGSTLILLYQRNHAAKRDERQKDIAAGLVKSEKPEDLATQALRDQIADLHKRLEDDAHLREEALALNRELQQRADQLADAHQAIVERLLRVACRYPKADGSASCGPSFTGETQERGVPARKVDK